MPQPDLVIFDCDGTLVDSEVIAARVDTELLAEAGIQIEVEDFIARYAGLTFTASPATDSPGWHTPDARRDNLLRDVRALMIYQFNRLWTGPP